MKKLVLALITLLMILLVGCYENLGSYKENVTKSIPSLKVFNNGIEIAVEKGGYQWTRRIGIFNSESVVADAASPDQIANKMKGDAVKSEAELRLEFSEEPTDVEVVSWGEGKDNSYASSIDKVVVPKEAGSYIYEIIGYWEQGQVSYTIKIVIK